MTPQLHCRRCSHTWTPRGDAPPVRCPRCSSVAWNKPKQARHETTDAAARPEKE